MGEKLYILAHFCMISDDDFTQNEVKMGEKLDILPNFT